MTTKYKISQYIGKRVRMRKKGEVVIGIVKGLDKSSVGTNALGGVAELWLFETEKGNEYSRDPNEGYELEVIT